MNRSSVRELWSLGRSWCIYCVYGIYGYAYMNLLMNACIHVCLNKCIINLLIYHTYCMLILLLHPYLHILTANIIWASLQNYLIRWNGRISEANLGDLFPHVSTRLRVPISGSMPGHENVSWGGVLGIFFWGKPNSKTNVILYILLMDKILHHQGWWLSHYLWGFNHPRWCRILSINSTSIGWDSWRCHQFLFKERKKTPKNQWHTHTHVLNSWNWPNLLIIDMIPDTPWKMPNCLFILCAFFLHIHMYIYIYIYVYHLFQSIGRYIIVYILYICIIFLLIFIHESFPCFPRPAMCFSCWGIGAGGLGRAARLPYGTPFAQQKKTDKIVFQSYPFFRVELGKLRGVYEKMSTWWIN